jgi:hypothetical protein
MFDSMRIRLTLWYTGLLGVVLVAFALTTYNYIYTATAKKTDDSLVESANSLIASLTTELNEGDQTPSDAIRDVTQNIRLQDRQFAVFDTNLKLVANSEAPVFTWKDSHWPSTENLARVAETPATVACLVDSPASRGQSLFRPIAKPLRHILCRGSSFFTGGKNAGTSPPMPSISPFRSQSVGCRWRLPLAQESPARR